MDHRPKVIHEKCKKKKGILQSCSMRTISFVCLLSGQHPRTQTTKTKTDKHCSIKQRNYNVAHKIRNRMKR